MSVYFILTYALLVLFLYTIADPAQFHLQSVDSVCATPKDFPGSSAVVISTATDGSFHNHTVQGPVLCTDVESPTLLAG